MARWRTCYLARHGCWCALSFSGGTFNETLVSYGTVYTIVLRSSPSPRSWCWMIYTLASTTHIEHAMASIANANCAAKPVNLGGNTPHKEQQQPVEPTGSQRLRRISGDPPVPQSWTALCLEFNHDLLFAANTCVSTAPTYAYIPLHRRRRHTEPLLDLDLFSLQPM